MSNKNILYLIILTSLFWPQKEGSSQTEKPNAVLAVTKKLKLAPAPSVKKLIESVQPSIDSLKELYNSKNRVVQLEKQLTELQNRFQDSVIAHAKEKATSKSNAKKLSERVKSIQMRTPKDVLEKQSDDSLVRTLLPLLFKIDNKPDTVHINKVITILKRLLRKDKIDSTINIY